MVKPKFSFIGTPIFNKIGDEVTAQLTLCTSTLCTQRKTIVTEPVIKRNLNNSFETLNAIYEPIYKDLEDNYYESV